MTRLRAVWLAFALALGALAASPLRAQPMTAPVPDAPPDLAGLVGRPVTHVDVEVEPSPWPTASPTVKGVRPEEPLTSALVRRLMAEALASGLFARAQVTAVAEGAGARLRVRVAPRRLIEAVRLELGGAPIERQEVLREGALNEDGEVTVERIDEATRKVRDLLRERGYPDAVVNVATRPTDEPSSVTVVLSVVPGAPRVVRRRYVYVFGVEPTRIAPLTSKYAVRVGDRADETSLESADVKLATALRARGWHRAAVAHDLLPQGGEQVLRVRVDAGPRFEPRFEGNDHFDADALSGALGLDEEGDRSPGKLVQKLEDFYQKRGFLDVEVRLEVRGGEADALRWLVFHVTEHERVVVTSRLYPCLKEAEVRALTEGGPNSAAEIGNEIDSYLDEDLPGADLLRNPDPTGLDRTLGSGRFAGERATPIELDPGETFFAASYDKAIEHTRDLYRNEGFLHAEVGPAQVVRRRCSPRSPAGECLPIALPVAPKDACTYDASNLPLPVPALDPALSCKPDPARGITCEPRISLRIPVKLGPRTFLYDAAFTGVKRFTELRLAQAAKLPMGEAVSALKIEEASRRILDAYREEGYAFAEVRYALEPSPDHTRARVRFDITEGEQVVVRGILIQGNRQTREAVIASRVALQVGEPYRATDVRKTQERIATLGVFESVEVGLEDPQVPQKRKLVIIRLVEAVPGYFEVRPGVASGEGARLTSEIGYRNLFGRAIGIAVRGQISHLPDFLIFDPEVRANFQQLALSQRITVRGTVTASFPDIGLGPLVRSTVDAVAAQDLQRGFLLQKAALIPAVSVRPVKDVELSLSQSAEYNFVRILGNASQAAAFQNDVSRDPTLARLLRVPEGPSVAFAQKFTVAWDRRDNVFSAHRGTYLVSSVEHVDSFGIAGEVIDRRRADGHFFRLTQTFSGYLPLPRRIVLAGQLRVGQNVHLFGKERSETYPDRLFFVGGQESVRGFLQDQIYPQDLSQLRDDNDPAAHPISGGNILVNTRVELRVPVVSSFDTVAFFDAGNVWVDPFSLRAPLDLLRLRTAAGTGIRWNSPVGVPVVFDVGFPLLPRPYERRANELFRYEVHFAMGLF